MPSKVYDDFSAGVDRRRERSMTEPSKAWSLRNCYVDTGHRIRQRPGVTRGTATVKCEGIVTLNGAKYTFAIKSTGASAAGYTVVELDSYGGAGAGNTVIKKVWFASPFSNTAGAVYWYVVVEYGDGTIRHHYTDVTDTRVKVSVATTGLYESTVVGIAGNRVWAASVSGTVRFCVLGNPRDWDATTTATGAGWLALNAQMSGFGNCTAIGVYQNDVGFFGRDAVQIWYPDVEKEKMFIRQRIPGIGTVSSRAVIPFGDDLMFLSDSGIRSLSVSTQTNSRIETDIGSAIVDYPLGQLEWETLANTTWIYPLLYPKQIPAVGYYEPNPFGRYFATLGQVWMAFPAVIPRTDLSGAYGASQDTCDHTAIAVLTYSRNGQLSSWSSYTVPYILKDFAELDGVVYAHYNTAGTPPYSPREANFAVSTLIDTLSNNSTAGFDLVIELPFLDMEVPGAEKMITGMDMIVSPDCGVSFLFSQNDETLETNPITVTGPVTHPNGMIPVELSATAIAPKITKTISGQAFKFSMLQLYYETLWEV